MALALGCTVAELQRRMSSREFAEWQAFVTVYGPIGPVRGDYHAAQVESTLINAWRGKGQKAVSLSDRVLKWSPPKRRKTAYELEMELTLWLRMNGARKVR